MEIMITREGRENFKRSDVPEAWIVGWRGKRWESKVDKA